MRMIQRIDSDTGDTLVWCGGENFNPLETQKILLAVGMTLKEIRDDKWAVIEQAPKENFDGRGK